MESRVADVTAANKAAWEASAPWHGAGPAWEKLLEEASRPGFSLLDSCLTATLLDIGISGRRAVQVGCNNARELLSLAALGAEPAMGIDQSGAFLAQGARLAKAAGLRPTLLEADIYALPAGLGSFDLVLITIGVLNWMPDLMRFFEIVAGLMASDGVLVIYETHPFLEVFDPAGDRPHEPAFSYFAAVPQKVEGALTYDGSRVGDGIESFWFTHRIGEIVTACVRAGLRLISLVEHPHSNREVDYAVYEGREAQLPMSYTLVARSDRVANP